MSKINYFSSDDELVILYKGEIKTITFDKLYELVSNESNYDAEASAFYKAPVDLNVLDSAKAANGAITAWTKVSKLYNCENTEKMTVISLSNGDEITLNENHTLYMDTGNMEPKLVNASALAEGYRILASRDINKVVDYGISQYITNLTTVTKIENKGPDKFVYAIDTESGHVLTKNILVAV